MIAIAKDIQDTFDKHGPLGAIPALSKFSLAWFVEKTFCNAAGRPMILEPFQAACLQILWTKKFPMMIMTRGGGKTFLLALYALIRCILVPGSKIVIVGAGYRQAKLVFREIHKLYECSPIIQEALSQWGGPKYGSDMASFRIGNSSIVATPIGDGEKVRGQRATVLLCDEFGSIPEEIFEVVILPFAAVHADPAAKAATNRFIKTLKRLGADQRIIDVIESSQDFGNQVVISGTGTYRQNHFFKRFQTYRAFLDSRGDKEALKKALESRAVAMTGKSTMISNSDIERMAKTWTNYAIIKIPYHALPEGFMDEDLIRSAKAANAPHIFSMEFEATFPEDTDGFIKRSWIERATPRAPEAIPVNIELYGDPRAIYVLGLDPARWNDNFGCVVLKLTSRGKELVYCASWDRKEFNKSANMIREICRRFPIKYIAMDKGGGGDAVLEWLCKKGQDGVGDHELIWPIPDQLENKADMSAPGRKILEMINFNGWSVEAAHSLEAAIQQCNILFPYKGDDLEIVKQYKRYTGVDNITESVAEELSMELWGIDDWEAKQANKTPKTGTFNDINECINETCSIIRDTTETGVERFVLPKVNNSSDGVDARRRDRFTALLLANYAANVYLSHGHKPTNLPGMEPTTRRIRRLRMRGVRRKGKAAY